MLPALPAFANPSARRGLFWIALVAVAIAQLAALWALCSRQVHAAEARGAGTRMERMAMAGCLQGGPGATLAACGGAGSVQDGGSGRNTY